MSSGTPRLANVCAGSTPWCDRLCSARIVRASLYTPWRLRSRNEVHSGRWAGMHCVLEASIVPALDARVVQNPLRRQWRHEPSSYRRTGRLAHDTQLPAALTDHDCCFHRSLLRPAHSCAGLHLSQATRDVVPSPPVAACQVDGHQRRMPVVGHEHASVAVGEARRPAHPAANAGAHQSWPSSHSICNAETKIGTSTRGRTQCLVSGAVEVLTRLESA